MSDTVAIAPNATSSSSYTAKPAASGRQVLEFERPLAQLETQIKELEAAQSARGVDYSAEIRQLRSNYVSLLKKTY